jgi:hypothetical protein
MHIRHARSAYGWELESRSSMTTRTKELISTESIPSSSSTALDLYQDDEQYSTERAHHK